VSLGAFIEPPLIHVQSPLSPGAQPVDGHAFNSMAPSDAEASRRLYPNSTAPPPLRQIISNARGRFPQLEMVNMTRTPVKLRGEDKTQHVDTVVERLEVVSYILHLAISSKMGLTYSPADGVQ
jgi:hypothetical protein